MTAEVQRLPRRSRVQHRDLLVGEGSGRRRRDGGALGRGIVARDHHRPAPWVGPGEHRVAEGVAGPVHSGSLGVEDAEDAVVAGVGAQGRELRSHHRGHRLLLVDGGLQHDGQVGRLGYRPGEVAVVAAHRRARVSAHEGGSLQPSQPVGPQLLHRQPGQCLEPGHEDGAGVVGVAGGQAIRVGDCQGRPPGVSGQGDGARATLVRYAHIRKGRSANRSCRAVDGLP